MLCQLALSALTFSASAYASSSSNADTYISTEGPLARAGMLANIGPDGSKSSGASPGVVVASPSTTNPNYVYTWVRDSSLVFKTMIDQFTTGQDDSFEDLINDFITAEAALQQVTNPSGCVPCLFPRSDCIESYAETSRLVDSASQSSTSMKLHSKVPGK